VRPPGLLGKHMGLFTEKVEAVIETLKLQWELVMSGSVSRPAPEVQRHRSRFRGTSAGEEVKHK
jgi:hypothetical protein